MPKPPIVASPKKSATSDRQKNKHHVLSPTLDADVRIRTAPRHVEATTHKDLVFIFKIYASLEIPGSELFTVSCVTKKPEQEFEMRFDEKFPISFKFKKQTDEERIETAKDQVKKQGGFDKLKDVFKSVFPKLGE